MNKPNTIDDFWLNVDKSSDCWNWTGAKSESGYGRFHFGGRRHIAHRFIYEHQNGKLPVGLNVLHKCDNPSCVRVDHLFEGTNLDNIKDRVSKNRSAKGAENGRAILTASDVLEIRKLYKKEVVTMKMLANKFGVTLECVAAIIYRRTWRNI